MSTSKYVGKGGWTGKHDISGTEIKDGDIMEYSGADTYYHHKPYLVEWDDDVAGFKCENASNYMLASVWDEMRIVGNRYDTLSLLEACK